MRIFTLTLFSFFFVSTISAQVNKTFVKSFNMKGDNFVSIEVDGPVEVKEWADEEILRVHTDVALENASSEALKFFLIQGRYSVRGNVESGTLKVKSSPRPQNVKYRGRELGESVKYTIFVPENVEVEIIQIGMAVNAAGNL